MSLIGGADGCRGGWFLVTKDLKSGHISYQKCLSTRELFDQAPSLEILALDIPIGLPEMGPRQCDLQARHLLKSGRASSIFPAPIRSVLSADSHERASELRFRVDGKKMSVQAWAIVGKVREVDEILQADILNRSKMYEVHPEVCFYHLADGKPCLHSKKKRAGRRERRGLLEPIYNEALQSAVSGRKKFACAEDDILDAFAALWTAERITAGKAQTIPSIPEWDLSGLPMKIVA